MNVRDAYTMDMSRRVMARADWQAGFQLHVEDDGEIVIDGGKGTWVAGTSARVERQIGNIITAHRKRLGGGWKGEEVGAMWRRRATRPSPWRKWCFG